jgi:hypothetical protein
LNRTLAAPVVVKLRDFIESARPLKPYLVVHRSYKVSRSCPLFRARLKISASLTSSF